jgi:hypothetical protein
MKWGVLLGVAGLCLLGQGCISLPAITPPTSVINEGEPSPEGLVTFQQGFGKLSGTRPIISPMILPNITVTAVMPAIPQAVTVLREWDAAPNDTLLRNITTAVQLPPGVLGAKPTGESLVLRWKDEDGIQWSYDATSVLPVTFRVSALSDMRNAEAPTAVAQAVYFLSDHGIDVKGWGVPEQVGQDVMFAASRDEQTVIDGRGMSVPDAVIRMESNARVTQGAFAIPRRMDRSNYPALSLEEVQERLKRGGTHPLTTGRISLSQLSIALYRHEVAQDGRLRIYYIPALWARGTVEEGAKTLPYETVVPLIRDDAFAS